ncbi:hypothetical protein [Secundilactobacillus kimchicus]|uniref:hypothetical protein n=1 Tax=Secundilactobacillus kimchicus TaxID=528209 RepID=UPI0024A9144A|nr:hypothetical protein [Secundilactobacillus kimchicus]
MVTQLRPRGLVTSHTSRPQLLKRAIQLLRLRNNSNPVKAATATETTDNSEGTALFNNIQTQINDKTSSWATSTEQGEIVKSIPSILNDIAGKLPDNPTGNGQIWYYQVQLTTGKYARVTIDGRTSNDSTLTQSMPALLKSLGKASTPGMFDQAVDISTLQNSSLYKTMMKMQGNGKTSGLAGIGNLIQAFASNPKAFMQLMSLSKSVKGTSSTSTSLLSGLFGSSNGLFSGIFTGIQKMFSGITNFFSNLLKPVSAVPAVPAVTTMTSGDVTTGKAMVPGSLTAATLSAPATIPMALLLPLLALGLFALPIILAVAVPVIVVAPIAVLALGGLTVKTAVDATISFVVANVIADTPVAIAVPILLGAVGLGIIGVKVIKALTLGAVVGLTLLNIIPIIIHTILLPINTAIELSILAGLFVVEQSVETMVKISLAVIGLALTAVGFVLFENHVVIPLAVLIGMLFVVPTTAILAGLTLMAVLTVPFIFVAAPLVVVAGVALLVVPALIISALILLPLIVVSGFAIGLAGVLTLLAIFLLMAAVALPVFLASPLLVKLSMLLVALIPIAGWAFKKFLELITAVGTVVVPFVLGISLTLPAFKLAIDAGGAAVSAAISTGSLLTVAFGPLAVRVLLGNRLLAFIPVTLLTFAAPFLAILTLIHMTKEIALGAVKIGSDLIGLTLVGVTIVASQIHTLIATTAAIFDPVAGLIVELLSVIPAFAGVLGLAAPVAVIFGLPLDILGDIFVPGLVLLNGAKFIGAFLLSAIALPIVALTLPIWVGLPVIYFGLNALLMFGLPLLSFVEALLLPLGLLAVFGVALVVRAVMVLGAIIGDVIGLGIALIDALLTTLPKVVLYMLIPVRLFWLLAIGGGVLAGVLAFGAFVVLGLLFGWVAKLALDVVAFGLPILGILLAVFSPLLWLLGLPINLLLGGLLGLPFAILVGLAWQFFRLFFGGVPFFLIKLLVFILPAVLVGLFTALIPGLNLLTVPNGLLAAIVGVPLALLGLIKDFISSLIKGAIAGAIVGGLTNLVLSGLTTLVLPILGLLLLPLIALLVVIALAVTPLVLGLLAISAIVLPVLILVALMAPFVLLSMIMLLPILTSLLLLLFPALLIVAPIAGLIAFFATQVIFWFLAALPLHLLVSPLADFVGFFIAANTLFINPILYWAFGIVTIPVTILMFIGMFTNWLNPLWYLTLFIAGAALNGLVIAPLIGLLGVDILRFGALLTLNPLAGVPAFVLGTLAKWALIAMPVLYGLNSLFVVALPLAIQVVIDLVIAFLLVFTNALFNVGINVPNVLLVMVLVPAMTTIAVLTTLLSIPFGLALDTLATVIGVIVSAFLLQATIVLGFLANPLTTIIAAILFAAVGVLALPLYLSGLYLLAFAWLPMSFNIFVFGFYAIFANPIWMLAQWTGLIPVIGWIVQLVTDWIYMPIGYWGTGILAALSFGLFVVTMVPLAFSASIPLAMFIAVLPVLLLLLPLALLATLALVGLALLPVIVTGVAFTAVGLLFGIGSVILITWFFMPVLTQILVNPVADMVTLVVAIFTIFNDPVFAWIFRYLLIPVILVSFIGMFVNWFNPLNWLFKAITLFAIVGLPILSIGGLLAIGGLMLVSFFSLNPLAGIPAALGFGLALVALAALLGIFFLNTQLVVLPLIALVWIDLVIGVVLTFANALLNLGINVPNLLQSWILMPMMTIFAVVMTMVLITGMLFLDAVATLIALPIIVFGLQVGLLAGLLAHPLITLLGALVFGALGLASIPMFIAGVLMIGILWLPATFNVIAFLWYSLLGNPVWMIAQFAGLFPIVGWLVQLVIDPIYLLLGWWGTGLIAANSFVVFFVWAIMTTFAMVIPFSMLLAVLPVLLLILPVALLGAGALLLLAAIPVVIAAILLALPVLLIGIGSLILIVWFLAPIVLQLLVNPIADFEMVIVLGYSMFISPVFFWGFGIFTIPALIFGFVGMFTNWLNPLNLLFHAVSIFALLGLPLNAIVGVLALVILAIGAFFSLNPLAGVPASFLLGAALLGLLGLIGLYFVNTFLVTVPLVIYVIAAVVIGFLLVFFNAFLNVGINVPNVLMIWIYWPFEIIFGVMITLALVPLMLALDGLITLIGLPLILFATQLGVLLGVLANPITGIIGVLGLAAAGLASIPLFLAGLYMIGYEWLPMTFSPIAFLLFFVMGNPVW